MKKALAGPAKPAAKKLPERRAMIAAAQRRIRPALSRAATWTRKADRAAARRLERAQRAMARRLRRALALEARWAGTAGRRLRPAAVLALRAFARGERRLRRASAAAARAAAKGSATITQRRAICGVVLASAACLVVSQFVDYRGVEVGQPGYAGLPAATPPTVGVKTAGQAHAYLLIPIALLASALAVASLRSGRRRLGRIVFVLGLLSLAVILLLDLPAGLDAGEQASRFAGATAVLEDGFYAELASVAGLMLGGLLLTGVRKPSLARTQGGRRSARTWFVRKRASRPRTQPDDGLQRPGATMRGRA